MFLNFLINSHSILGPMSSILLESVEFQRGPPLKIVKWLSPSTYRTVFSTRGMRRFLAIVRASPQWATRQPTLCDALHTFQFSHLMNDIRSVWECFSLLYFYSTNARGLLLPSICLVCNCRCIVTGTFEMFATFREHNARCESGALDSQT
jgi:hypothetical protein